MLFTDVKYANMVCPSLRNFKKRGDFLWNFSCPICGDSQKNKLKARGYLYKYKDGLRAKCHNCDYSASIRTFLKDVDTLLYNEYVVECYTENRPAKPTSKKKQKPTPLPVEEEEIVDTVLDTAKRLDTLPADHPAVLYVKGRKLPDRVMKLLYYVPAFKKFVNRIFPNKFENLENDVPRLVIPYFNEHGAVYAIQGRAFGQEEPRYITIKLNPEANRIYGMDRVDFRKRIYIVEGPLDSLCLPNAIAVSGSSFGSYSVEALKANATIVFDNEPRSPEITKLLKRVISKGFSVCIWPPDVTAKDINEMLQLGMTEKEIVQLIDNNTFQGPMALLKFTSWKKC